MMSLRERTTDHSGGASHEFGVPAEWPSDLAQLPRLVETAILGSLAPDDALRRAYLRARWHGGTRPALDATLAPQASPRC